MATREQLTSYIRVCGILGDLLRGTQRDAKGGILGESPVPEGLLSHDLELRVQATLEHLVNGGRLYQMTPDVLADLIEAYEQFEAALGPDGQYHLSKHGGFRTRMPRGKIAADLRVILDVMTG